MKTKVSKNILIALLSAVFAVCAMFIAYTVFTKAEHALADNVSVTEDANYLAMTDGTVTVNDWQASAPYNKGGIYYDSYVEVADDEDLIIEYDFISEGTAGANFFTLFKGIQKNAQGKPEIDVNSAVEAVHARYTGGYSYAGLGSNFGELMRHYNIADYDASEELKAYLTENYVTTDSNYYAFPDGSVANTNGWSCGVDFYYLADVKQESFKTQGKTYKHVFLASGGYECYQKDIGAPDSEYALILKTADTYYQDWYHVTKNAPDEKIFTHRSGYIGFMLQSMNYSEQVMTIDNFEVSVAGDTERVVISDTFNRATLSEDVQNNWGYFAGGATEFNFSDEINITSETRAEAELRLDLSEGEKKSGIRFTSTVNVQCADFLLASVEDGSAQSVEFGTLITAKDILGDTEFAAEAMDAAGKFYYNVKASGFMPETDNGNYVYKATLVNIKTENYNREWVARGYAKITLADGTVKIIYNDFSADNSRSIYSLACAAYADTAAEWSDMQLQVLTDYLDGVVDITADGAYAGTVAEGYIPAYTAEAADGTITVTSSKPIAAVIVNGTAVDAEISVSDGVYTAVYTV